MERQTKSNTESRQKGGLHESGYYLSDMADWNNRKLYYEKATASIIHAVSDLVIIHLYRIHGPCRISLNLTDISSSFKQAPFQSFMPPEYPIISFNRIISSRIGSGA